MVDLNLPNFITITLILVAAILLLRFVASKAGIKAPI